MLIIPNRILKESICTSCEIDNLTAEEERFFYRLIVNCDDFGRMDARPSVLRAKCFPLKLSAITDEQVDSWLRALNAKNLLRIYQVEQKPYLQVLTWHKHQQKRAMHSKYPEPDFNCNQMSPRIENRETRNEKRIYGDLFEHLWSLYPRKKGKGAVSDKQKERIYEIGKEHMERCIARFKQHMKSENRSLDKYPYGSTFFNSRYVDYLDENYQEEARPKPKSSWDNLPDYTFKGKRPEIEAQNEEKANPDIEPAIPDELKEYNPNNISKNMDKLIDIALNKSKQKG